MAVHGQFPDGVRDQGLSLMSDNGCQPTSIAFMAACSTLGVHQMFTSYNNPKGNADTERFMRTLKEECLWLQEWSCPFQLISRLASWIEEYSDLIFTQPWVQTPDSLNTTPATALHSRPLD